MQQTTGALSTQHVAGVLDGGMGLSFVSHSGGLPVKGPSAFG